MTATAASPTDVERLDWLEHYLPSVLLHRDHEGRLTYDLMGPPVPWPEARPMPDPPGGPYRFHSLRELADAALGGHA